jgi:AGCS family alanine or glycine:cation symporter
VNIQNIVDHINDVLVNWPLFIFVIATCIICTIAFKFIQFRYFFYAWKQILFPAKAQVEKKNQDKVDMTPIQAFINTLSTNLGNGAIAGMATAIYAGGPGAALWVIFFGFLVMVMRFAEVFLSMHYGSQLDSSESTKLGGPMLYLRKVPFGRALAYIYALLCLPFGFLGGNGVQAKSISVSLVTTFGKYGVTPLICAAVLFFFMLYVLFGGAARVVKVSEQIMLVKVIVFFGTTLLVLAYHFQAIPGALALIWNSAFSATAASGAVLGFTVQQAIRLGMARSIFASESGLGTAAILFGHTGSTAAVKDGIISTLSTFLSTLVCFIVSLCIVASGVWNSGLKSTDLTIAAFSTVFGESLGGIAVSFLAISFGIGVAVSYAYICREVWLFLTGGRWTTLFAILYCLCAFVSAIVDVKVVWDAATIPMCIMLIINLFGILYLLPVIKKSVDGFIQSNT